MSWWMMCLSQTCTNCITVSVLLLKLFCVALIESVYPLLSVCVCLSVPLSVHAHVTHDEPPFTSSNLNTHLKGEFAPPPPKKKNHYPMIYSPSSHPRCNDFHLSYEYSWLYAQLHYFLNLSQLLVSCLPLLAKLD